MSEQSEPNAQEPNAEQQAQTPGEPGQQAERTFKQSEVEALIRDRLASAQRKADEAVKKAAADAEAKALIEQGKFKELYEAAEEKTRQAEQRAHDLEMAQLRAAVAARVGIPVAFASRLQGDDEATLEADAKQLLAALPKPSAPNINAAPGAGVANQGQPLALYGGMTEAEFAATYGVNPAYMKQQ